MKFTIFFNYLFNTYKYVKKYLKKRGGYKKIFEAKNEVFLGVFFEI